MTDLKLVKGQNPSWDVVVLGAVSDVLSGSWSWGGTTTVLSNDTSGVVAGQWVRLPKAANGKDNPLFKVTFVAAGVSVTIENPKNKTIPVGLGIQAGTPEDLADKIVRFALKKCTSKDNTAAVLFKTSYSPAEIEIISPTTLGEMVIKTEVFEMNAIKKGSYEWEVEVNERDTVRTNTGTMTALASTITFIGVDMSLFHEGDILVPSGTLADNQVPVILTDVDVVGLQATSEGYSLWKAEAAFSFVIYRGVRSSPVGLSGVADVDPKAVD